ncbi:unnamed protein product [Soboliphyme baturini]|uniref:CUB domain-containing protein n=1 Tax=Soboliphyme baturini TaxID=241478 RepID=A0A183JAK9_9BILA|nr:unnamed protein product [Soboliphyme baturini]
MDVDVYFYDEAESKEFPVARFATGIGEADRRGGIKITLDRGVVGDVTFSFSYSVSAIHESKQFCSGNNLNSLFLTR